MYRYEELTATATGHSYCQDQPAIKEVLDKLHTFSHMDNKTVSYGKVSVFALKVSVFALKVGVFASKVSVFASKVSVFCFNGECFCFKGECFYFKVFVFLPEHKFTAKVIQEVNVNQIDLLFYPLRTLSPSPLHTQSLN